MKKIIEGYNWATGNDIKTLLEIERNEKVGIVCNMTFDDTTIGLEVDDKLMRKIYDELYKDNHRAYNKPLKEIWWWILEHLMKIGMFLLLLTIVILTIIAYYYTNGTGN